MNKTILIFLFSFKGSQAIWILLNIVSPIKGTQRALGKYLLNYQ